MARQSKSWQRYVGDVLTLVPLAILAVFFFIGGIVWGGISFALITAVLFWLTVLHRPEQVEPAQPLGPPPEA